SGGESKSRSASRRIAPEYPRIPVSTSAHDRDAASTKYTFTMSVHSRYTPSATCSARMNFGRASIIPRMTRPIRVLILVACITGTGAALPAQAPARFDLEEATIADLQQRMQSGRDTARSLVEKYLARIEQIDRNGPSLHSVLETNPDALTIADALDAERRSHGPRRGRRQSSARRDSSRARCAATDRFDRSARCARGISRRAIAPCRVPTACAAANRRSWLPRGRSAPAPEPAERRRFR